MAIMLKTGSKELIFNVENTRTQRKFADKNDESEPVPMTDKSLPYGFLAEVTELDVKGGHWCSITVEVFGNPAQPMVTLQKGVKSLFSHYEDPDL